MSIYLKEISNYLQQLSEEHVQIAHSSTNRAFCRYNDGEQFNQLRANASKNIVIIKSFLGRATGEYDDAEMKNTLVVCFSCYAKTVTSTEIVRASELAFEIMLDFFVRMRNDFEQDDCTWLKNIDWTSIQFDEIEQPWLQNHYGWDLVLPYKTTLPAYDADKWRITNGS